MLTYKCTDLMQRVHVLAALNSCPGSLGKLNCARGNIFKPVLLDM